MSQPRTPRQPKASPIRARVRTLNDDELAKLITALRFNTKLEQSVLAIALQEKRRCRKPAEMRA